MGRTRSVRSRGSGGGSRGSMAELCHAVVLSTRLSQDMRLCYRVLQNSMGPTNTKRVCGCEVSLQSIDCEERCGMCR